MTNALIQHVQKRFLRNHPEIRPGYTVKVYQKIKEGNKERVQMFEGLVIKVSAGHGLDKTFTVRRIASGVGVEKVFPFHSATIEKIEVTKKAKIRRAKLYYMRERSGKSARLKEEHVKEMGDMSLLHEEKPEVVAEEAAVETETLVEETVEEVTEESTTEEVNQEEKAE